MRAARGLPFPTALLALRAHNAKSPKDRHDTAYYAWEVSLRIAVAASPPAAAAPLARAGVGEWVRAASLDDRPRDAAPLLATFALLSQTGSDRAASPRSVSPRRLLDALPAYRNRVLGHGSIRPSEFYDEAGRTLLEGVRAAWQEDVFLPGGTRLVYVESVELDAMGPPGSRRARILDLLGESPLLEDPRGTPGIPGDVLPGRVYARGDSGYRTLHPWVLFRPAESLAQTLFFNALKRTPEYLDYASGEVLRGKDLAEAFPTIEAEVAAVFGETRRPDLESEKEDPSRFGEYTILGKLGEGGMGVVYLARQESLGRLVALKMLPPHLAGEPTAVARFQREVKALSRSDHPNVVKILASGHARGTHYYAMEYIEGADLARVARALSTSGDFDAAVSTASAAVREEKADLFAGIPHVPVRGMATAAVKGEDRYRKLAAIFRDAARGLHDLHEQGILHRDIKPGNLMVTGDDHRVVVMDLGLAAVGDASRTITRDASSILGTLRYMPPEQLQRSLLKIDRRVDVYALGATLYELVTDRPFFDGESEAQLIQQVLREEPVPPRKANPKLPADLATIVSKATEKEPRLRYDTAAAMAEDLDAFAGARPIAARPPTLGYVLGLAVRRNKPLAATLAAAILVLVAGATFAYIRERTLREVAEAGRRRAQSLALAAASEEAVRTGVPTRALLLAREAVWTDVLPTAVQSLRDTLVIMSLERKVLYGHESTVPNAAFSPDGSRILTASSDKTARLWDLEGHELVVLRGHEAEVRSAKFSPDGSRIVTASFDRTARIWDREGKVLAVLRGHDGMVSSATFSPDGSRIVTPSFDKTARIWDSEGKELAILRGHEDVVRSAAFSPDGSRIVTASSDKTARIWDLEGKELGVLRGHEAEVWRAAFSPDGSRIVTASNDKTARLWERQGKEIAVLRGHEREVYSATFSPDGSRIVTASRDETARLWDREGKELAVLRGHEAVVWFAVFSPDGSRIVTASLDKTARLWSREGKELAILRGHEAVVVFATFSPDSARIVTASEDRTACLWDREGHQVGVLRGHEAEVASATYSPDGNRIVTASGDKTAHLWDRDGKELAFLRGHEGSVTSAAFSPDGSRIVTASEDKTARLWDREGTELAVLRGHDASVVSAAFSPDGSRIVTASEDKTARLWDHEGKELGVLRGHGAQVLDVAFSPNGNRIVTASLDKTARLWDREGTELAVLRGHEDQIWSAAFSVGGSRIVTASSDMTARLWDREGKELAVLRGHTAPVVSAIFSPDGSLIVTTSHDMTARLWDREGKGIAILRGHAAALWLATFSPDGSLIVTASLDKTARLWDREGKEVAVLRGHEGDVNSTAFSPDSSRIVTASADKTARIWLVHTADLLKLAEARLSRDFTPQEVEKYHDLLSEAAIARAGATWVKPAVTSTPGATPPH